ncbi:uncharacterized protein Dwil_GK28239 [Drosophila willistoni]|uniref:Uncharacterized protein n=1 Tax=Drosophila willistoni TaxID=7260 RepID=A0A0Q9WXW0_DROWI|nr:uncharacterized protein LOC26530241 [Drosophila willistoni]KRF98414.1 uncharacterized protein Dwil_GK28239 [Drosophila willistoni]
MATTISTNCTQLLSLNQKSASMTTFTLDASRFAQKDLGLFMESLETISRLERERHERRQRRREQKIQQARIAELESERCVSPTPSAEEAVDEPVMYLEAKCIPYAISEELPMQKNFNSNSSSKRISDYYSCDDEAYGSVNQSPRSSVTYCSCGGISSNQDSDSAESGIYGQTSSSASPPPLRPRSQVISQPKARSTRSRIISLVLKREYAKAPSAEQLDQPERCDRMVNETIKHKFDQLSSKSRRGIAFGQGSAEERFLDKALRYLTL